MKAGDWVQLGLDSSEESTKGIVIQEVDELYIQVEWVVAKRFPFTNDLFKALAYRSDLKVVTPTPELILEYLGYKIEG